MSELTAEERKAIAALRRLAKRWPQTLMLFAGGTISIRKAPPGQFPGVQYEVESIDGIPCDGGDGGDTY